MWLRVAVVIIGLLQLAVACRRGSSKQVPATCSHFDRCAECPVPPLQCAACGRGEVMSSDKQKCLACPGNCQLCRYNNDTKKAECAKCNDGYALSDGHMTCTAVSGCDGSAAVLTTEEGTFGITNTQYQNNMKCGWRIHVEPTQVVQLEFLSFDIEFGEPCTRFDVVKVYEGANDAAPLLGEFCGTSVPPHVTSTNADLFVSFKTDSTHTKNGFNIKHTAMVRVCDSNCTSCADNGAGKCDPGQCHDRFAFDATNKTCEACDPNCNSCSNNGPGKCDSGKCHDRYALDATAKICGACGPSCDGCATNGAGKCDSGKCHALYVHDDVSQTCQPCHPNCGGCATNGAGKCDPGECHDRYILDDVNKTCQPCGENCFNCDVSGAGRCNFDGCDYNYALNTTINTCEACPDNCKRCSYNTAQDQVECDQCISAFVVNNNKTCTACGENCYSCATNGPGTCDPGECDEGYKLFMSSNTCGVCASHCLACTEPHECDPDKCLPGYVFDAAYSTCSPCSANCRKCNNSGEGLCDSGKCATGYTHDTANNTCTPCAPNCMVCNRNGPGQCDKGQCSRRYVHNPNTSRCVACPIDCEVCSYSTTRLTTECTECYGPLGVNSEETCSGCSERCHSCIDNGAGKCDPDECHIGYTLGPDYTCKECPPNCVLCHYTNDTTECTQCYGIFGLKDDDKTCEACDPHCDSCAVNGAAKCDTGRCKSPAVFDDVSKTCKPCPRHCASCEYVNNRTECRHCDDLFGIKQEDKTCEACDPNCDSCTSSGAGKCDSGQCHHSYVPDVASETCKQCPDHCVRCIYNTSANRPECYECEVSYTLTTGQTCKACNGPLENCNMCSFGEFVCVRCSLPYTMNKTTHECNGATASLLHGGSWLTAYAMTATTIIVLVTGPVM